MVKETDYCGLASGSAVDKAQLFHDFLRQPQDGPYGCWSHYMECKLIKVVDFPKHDVFIGRDRHYLC